MSVASPPVLDHTEPTPPMTGSAPTSMLSLPIPENTKPRPANAEERANPFSLLIFGFLTSLVWKGYKQQLNDEDLWELSKTDEAMDMYRRWRVHWENELAKQKANPDQLPSTGKSLIRTFLRSYLISLIWQCFAAAASLTQPVILGYLVGYLRFGAADGGRDGYLWGLGFGLLALVRSLCTYQSLMIALRTGIRMRIVCIVAVYQKTLRISSVARSDLDSGQIVSLISNDAQRVFEIFMFLNEGILAPPQIIVVIGLLYRLIYAYTFAGLGVLLVILPINIFAMKGLQTSRGAMILKTDRRTKLLNEVFQAIKIVKFYAWERSFQRTIGEAREAELVTLRAFSNYRAVVIALIGVLPTLMAMVAFLALGANNPIFPEIIFQALSLFNLLRLPLTLAPMLIASLAQLNIAMDRMRNFLTLQELPYLPPEEDILNGVASLDEVMVEVPESATTAPSVLPSVSADDVSLTIPDSVPRPQSGHQFQERSIEEIIRVVNGSFRWGLDATDPVSLRNVNFSATKGQLIMVVGQVGSGKSTLVNAILGEIPQASGSLYLKGTIGYVPQQAWIVNATLRNNVLFGHEFDADKYKRTLDQCSLKSDIEVLPGGDSVEIGERGVNLSGGQKQRIAIARAVYAETDIVVMDDPLSAVDAHVGRHIFHECVRGALKDRAVIMVTNQLQYLPHADYILVLKAGAVVESGTYAQLIAQKLEFAALIEAYAQSDAEYETDDGVFCVLDDILTCKGTVKRKRAGSVVEDQKKGDKKKSQLVVEEERQTGLVSFGVWVRYFKSPGSIWIFISMLLWFFLEAAGYGVSSYWLSLWSQDTTGNVNLYLGVYAGLSIGTAVFSLIRSFWNVWFSISSSRMLHSRLLAIVLRFPQSFFDTTPLGRILNRFTKDIDNVDILLPQSFSFMLLSMFLTLTTLVTIAAVSPWTLIPMAPLAVAFYFISAFYRKTSVELQRLEALSRGPVLSHFSETVAGRSSIRAYKAQRRFALSNFNLADRNTRAFLTLQMCNQWLGLRLDTLGAILLFLVCVLLVAAPTLVGPGVAALALSQSLTLMNFLNRLAVQTADTETKMNAPERIDEYARLPEEAPSFIEGMSPPPEWPTHGEVRFQNVYMMYRPGLPYVIQDLSFTVNGGEKVGVVGRTGAGKSSVMLLLFRIIEVPKTPEGVPEGQIFVDGIDIATIGLDDLRLRFAIIPQEPFLFSGTIRSNLDPFEQSSDDDVWNTLKHIQLYDMIHQSEHQLNHPVFEGGENFSVGQRQLICLGRALLRKPKILLMDEATASVDVETDALIQQTVREQFAESTIITIAHRINTIIDYDRVMVLNRGRLAEFDTPAALLKNSDGIFTSLVNDTGAESAQYLRSVAFAKAGLIPKADVKPPLSENLPVATPTDPAIEMKIVEQSLVAEELRHSQLQATMAEEEATNEALSFAGGAAAMTGAGATSGTVQDDHVMLTTNVDGPD